MASPTLKVEIAFTSDPLDTTPTWVDVSAYVRATSGGGGGVSIRRGKSSEIDPFEAGAATVTLSNRDRRFDPSYSAGPHFGNLIPRKQLRITATWASVDYPMFAGFVTGWPQGFTDAGKDATVTIEAIDALAWLANNNLPNDLVYDYANTTIGSLAFFLREATPDQWSDATGNGYFARPRLGTGTTSSSIAPGSASPAVTFSSTAVWATNQRFTSAGAWSISFWLRASIGSVARGVFGGGAPGFVHTRAILGTAPGKITLNVWDASSSGINIGSSENVILDGDPHHVVFTCDNTTAANSKVYVDGVDRTASASGTIQPFLFDAVGAMFADETDMADIFNGALQDIAVFNKQLSAAEVAAFYQYSSGYLPESSADRVTRLLDDVGWPGAWRDITTTDRAEVGELVYNGSSALPKLQEVERSEQGMLFAARDGDVTFRERYYADEVTVGNTVQQIFSDDGGATALGYSSFQFQFNDIDVTNAVSVTTPTTRAASSDAVSITANGRQSKQVDTILSSFEAANAMAEGLVAEGKDPTWRVAPISAYPSRNDTRWDEILSLELGYRVSMEQTPMKVGSQNAQEVTLQQIEWSIVDSLWTLTIAGSPCFGAAAGSAGWFIVGSSLVNGPDLVAY